MSNFIDDCLSGNARLEDIDDYIDAWHQGDSDKKLYEFLGMTKPEYELLLSGQDMLPIIISAHKEHLAVVKILKREFDSIAARSNNLDKMSRLKKWLKVQG